jgi:hypothetical protein
MVNKIYKKDKFRLQGMKAYIPTQVVRYFQIRYLRFYMIINARAIGSFSTLSVKQSKKSSAECHV